MRISNKIKMAMMTVAVMLLASGVWADEVPEPITGEGGDVPMAVKALLFLLPVVGAWCLYRVMRRRA